MQQMKSKYLQCVIINKSDEIVAGAGDFGVKSSSLREIYWELSKAK